MWRKMTMDAIKSDPAWHGGDYASEPLAGLRGAADLLVIAGSAPLAMQKSASSRDAADTYVADTIGRDLATLDANDLLYQVDASRNYDPSGALRSIKAEVMWVNSADDFINPPELGIAETKVKDIPHARFVLLPISDQTHGHGTHTWAAVWRDYLEELLKKTERRL